MEMRLMMTVMTSMDLRGTLRLTQILKGRRCSMILPRFSPKSVMKTEKPCKCFLLKLWLLEASAEYLAELKPCELDKMAKLDINGNFDHYLY